MIGLGRLSDNQTSKTSICHGCSIQQLTVRLLLIGCAITSAAAACAQPVRLYNCGWVTSAKGEAYWIKSTNPNHIINFDFEAEVQRLSDSAFQQEAFAVWPTSSGLVLERNPLVISGTLRSATKRYNAAGFDRRPVNTHFTDIPLAMSADGQSFVSTKGNKTDITIWHKRVLTRLSFKRHILAAALSYDGSKGVLSFQNGASRSFTFDKKGGIQFQPIKAKFASPMFGPCWQGDTVALFASSTGDTMGLSSVWLCNVRTGRAKNLGQEVLSVTATNRGFLALNGSGELFLLDMEGHRLKTFGKIPALKGYYYERGPIAYDFSNKQNRLAGGGPISIAFDRNWVYALNEFADFKKAPLPWKTIRPALALTAGDVP